MKLAGYKTIEGVIEVITGLHIGGSTAIIEIGGKDNPVIKHPFTKEPYIPGSSLKGKMRSLLEWKLEKIKTNPQDRKSYGEVHTCEVPDKKCPICIVFGTSADNAELGPTRLIVRDAIICPEYKIKINQKDSNWTVFDLTEDKYENTINRITARANPRNFERVVSGVQFKFSMSYRVFKHTDPARADDETLFENVLDGLRMIERDALGGAGSRGCGQVAFKVRVGEELKSLDEVTSADFPTEGVGATL